MDRDGHSTECDNSNNSDDVVVIAEYANQRVKASPSVEDNNLDSANNSIQILDETEDKSSVTLDKTDPINSVEILSTDEEISSSNLNCKISTHNGNVDSYNKLFKEEKDADKLSPVYLASEHVNFDAVPGNSTPNEIIVKDTFKIKSPDSDLNSLGHSTESLLNLPAIQKKVGIYVELTALIHMGKESWAGELLNVTCDDLSDIGQSRSTLSDSSGHLADKSTSSSSSSTNSATNVFQLPQKQQVTANRFSVVSSTSSSSVSSSANTLMMRLARDAKFGNANRKLEPRLTDERIKALKEKWLNSDDIYKVLDFLDRIVLCANDNNIVTTTNSDENLKTSKQQIFSINEESLEESVSPNAVVSETTTPIISNKSRLGTRSNRNKRQATKPRTNSTSENSDKEIPKKRRVEIPPSVEMSTPIPLPESIFHVGSNVFAKWKDRKFYAGQLIERHQDGKWKVLFFDGDEKFVSEEHMIKAEEFMLHGQSVYASQCDDNYTLGIITGCESVENVIKYTIARDSGDIVVPCQFIYITESQARQIRNKMGLNNVFRNSKAQENILILNPITKRSARLKNRLLESPKPSSSGLQQIHSETIQQQYDSDDDLDDTTDTNLEDVYGIEPEVCSTYENGLKLKGKYCSGKMRFSKVHESDLHTDILGPIPEEGSTLFKNFHILLTCTRPPAIQEKANDNQSSNEGYSTDNEYYAFTTVPFLKNRVKLQLERGGALVCNSIDEIPRKTWKNTLLITNRPSYSARSIQCLAAGIKSICHEWVIRCCIENKRLAMQELPAGWSIERDRFINFVERKSSSTMKKLHLLLVDVGENKNFCKFWLKVCNLADINAAKMTHDSSLEKINAVISEVGYRDENIERALTHNVPVVTSNWLIQSLLHGEPRRFDAHKLYCTEYVDSD